MPSERTLAHLHGLYAQSDDPWDHRRSAYEADKYAATLAAVGRGPFREALELGCGNGELARRLAPLCARYTGLECVPRAAQAARAALRDMAGARVIEGTAPDDLPDISPDLLMLSEVLYYLRGEEIDALAAWLGARAAPGALVVAVNWLGPTGEALDGRGASARFFAALGRTAARQEGPGFVIDVLRLDQQRSGTPRSLS